jgi:hypothetical protein
MEARYDSTILPTGWFERNGCRPLVSLSYLVDQCPPYFCCGQQKGFGQANGLDRDFIMSQSEFVGFCSLASVTGTNRRALVWSWIPQTAGPAISTSAAIVSNRFIGSPWDDHA